MTRSFSSSFQIQNMIMSNSMASRFLLKKMSYFLFSVTGCHYLIWDGGLQLNSQCQPLSQAPENTSALQILSLKIRVKEATRSCNQAPQLQLPFCWLLSFTVHGFRSRSKRDRSSQIWHAWWDAWLTQLEPGRAWNVEPPLEAFLPGAQAWGVILLLPGW